MFKKILECEGKKLGLAIEDLPLLVCLKSGVMFNLCFIESEDEDVLCLAVTQEDFTEHFHIINKDEVEFVKIVYQTSLEEDEEELLMYQ